MNKRHNHDRLPNNKKKGFLLLAIIPIVFFLYYFGFFDEATPNSEVATEEITIQKSNDKEINSDNSKNHILDSFSRYQNLNGETVRVHFSEGNQKFGEDNESFNSLRFFEDDNVKELVFIPNDTSKSSITIHHNEKDVSVISTNSFMHLFELLNSSLGIAMNRDVIPLDMLENLASSAESYKYIDFREFFNANEGEELSSALSIGFLAEPLEVFVGAYKQEGFFKSNAFVVNEKNLYIGIESLLKSKKIASFAEENFGFSKETFLTNPQVYTIDFLKENNIDTLNVGIALTSEFTKDELNQIKILISYKTLDAEDVSHFTILLRPTAEPNAQFSKNDLLEGDLLGMEELSSLLMGNNSNIDKPNTNIPSTDAPTDATVYDDVDRDSLTPVEPLDNDGFIEPLSKFASISKMPSTLVYDFVGEDGIHYQTYAVDQYDEYGGNNDAVFTFYYTSEGIPVPISLEWSKYVDEELTHYYDFNTYWMDGIMYYEIFYGHVSETGELVTTQVDGHYNEKNNFVISSP